MPRTKTQALIDLVRSMGIVRPRDLDGRGIPRMYLTRLHQQGLLHRTSRGVYTLPDAEPTENHDLAEASKRVPHAVVCLLSALRLHGLTTQAPFEVWLAIDRKARLPRVNHPPLHVVRFSGAALTEGVEQRTIEGVSVRVTTPARTVVDCFAYRNKIGLDVALEALRDCWRGKRATMNDLHSSAKARRMEHVMRPYLESLV
jgi:predicted transcriptional regulator of viral defense system